VVTLLVPSSTLPGNPIEKSPNRIIFGASVAALTFVYSFFFTGLILKEKIPDENPLAYSLIIAAVVSVGFGIVWPYMFSKMMMRWSLTIDERSYLNYKENKSSFQFWKGDFLFTH